MDFINEIHEFDLNIQQDTFYFQVKNLKKEFLCSNISIISSNKDNNISFFSSSIRNNILLEIRKIINDPDIKYYILLTKNFHSSENINMIDLLCKIFNFKFIKYNNLDLFWYGIVLNDPNKNILEEKILDLGKYQKKKFNFKYEINYDFMKRKEELEETMDKLKDNCKELTIQNMLEYKKIINENMKELEVKKMK